MSRGRSLAAVVADADGSREHDGRVRLDKWLWAARLFKTRAQAQAAVEGGKVHYDDQRVKPGHAVRLGARICVRQGFENRELIILALAERRGSATAAQLLYEETADSVAKREANSELRRAAALSRPISEGRPDKRQRRQLDRLRHPLSEQD